MIAIAPPTVAAVPGRSCPLDYLYPARALRDAPALEADVVWVVGGLYGNVEALEAVRRWVDAERAPRVEVVLNGDFHWFDADPDRFDAIERGVAGLRPMRGNVETELARADDGFAAGCGCAYPPQVPQADVDRSNAMIERLRGTARSLGAAEGLGALPMLRRARVGALRIGIVHGDDRSLAGWRLAHDSIAASRADGLDASFDAADVDLIASSHTCVPVADAFASRTDGRLIGVINNGAAGMANFAGTTHGLVTRIAAPGVPEPAGLPVAYRAAMREADVAAVGLHFDLARFLAAFDATWPVGSAGERSYRARIVGGGAFARSAAIRGAFRGCA